jgi:hypothetical protein
VKQYPSIPRVTDTTRPFDAYLFAKLDGSNLRFEWAPKVGWSKAGIRHRLLDPNDPVFAPALTLFEGSWAEPLTRIARDSRWPRLTVFLEFYGRHSLAGQHEVGDPKTLTLFDAAPFGGLLGPAEFLRFFGDLAIAPYLGQARFDADLAQAVRVGEFPGSEAPGRVAQTVFEGVVAKGISPNGREVLLAKAKSQAWIDAVRARHTEADARRIIES